jgi:hypothetical protein
VRLPRCGLPASTVTNPLIINALTIIKHDSIAEALLKPLQRVVKSITFPILIYLRLKREELSLLLPLLIVQLNHLYIFRMQLSLEKQTQMHWFMALLLKCVRVVVFLSSRIHASHMTKCVSYCARAKSLCLFIIFYQQS